MDNQIKTNNLISTPNITGNIGSCNTQAQQVIENSSFWKDTGKTITTNSCTGETKTFDYYSINEGGYLVTILGIICITFVLCAIFRKPDNITQSSLGPYGL